ncbi:helix-turn-helix transcriptional regulator [Hamadaea sp. NPDC050747]|uniref:helix-turn-helix transcriptional regulator n=1 Tax=Hamadaea sp. NPDC050747 TaxID=3155789 RepID=UPI0033EC716B
METTVGQVLRSLRTKIGLSQADLARHAHTVQSHVANVEADRRELTPELAEAFDRVLGSAPLLAILAALGGDDMQRRTLLMHLGEGAAVGAISGPGGLAEIVRAGLLDAAGVQADWDERVADYRHRLTADGSASFGRALMAQLMAVRYRLNAGPTPELLRAAAGLGSVFGLWLGNTGDLVAAHGWYVTANELATMSGDAALTSYVVGRSASRAIYEGWTVARTVEHAERALDLAGGKPGAGPLEAYAALVHVHALTGDAKAGRAAAASMVDVADAMGDPSAHARALFLAAFGEARYGTADTATEAYAAARPALVPHPLWAAEARVYLGRALVASGAVADGARVALDAVTPLQDAVRVVGVAVRDAVTSAPERTRSDDLDALRAYADPAPGPWETLR